MQTHETRPTLAGMFLQHVIVFFICVVFPGVVTMMAPATWVSFQRNGEAVTCTTRTCMFFVVPYRIQHVDQVTGISNRERSATTRREREHGRDTGKIVHVDGEGFLQIHGSGDEFIEVSVSPASLESVVGKCNQFLSSTAEDATTIFAIANWKFGALMGGLLTSFTALYVVGYTIGLLKWIGSFLKSAGPQTTL